MKCDTKKAHQIYQNARSLKSKTPRLNALNEIKSKKRKLQFQETWLYFKYILNICMMPCIGELPVSKNKSFMGKIPECKKVENEFCSLN